MSAFSWGDPDSALVSTIADQRQSALRVYREDPKLLEEHARQEKSFQTSGYSRRQITELLQNASDAIYRSGKVGDVELVLTPSHLYCANAGISFTSDGLIAVTHAYLSDKRGNEIGRYGLGFKSVLTVSDNPQIFSTSGSFEFGSTDARSALRSVGATDETMPVLRLPTPLDMDLAMREDSILRELASWATTIVRLPFKEIDLNHLVQQIDEFQTQFLIFTPHVRSLRMRHVGADGQERIVDHSCTKKDRDTYEITGPKHDAQTWAIFSKMHVPTQAALSEVDDAIARKTIAVTFAAPIDGRAELGEFWANFPLADRTSARGIFNAPWALTEDRSRILTDKLYNRQIFDTCSELFVASLPRLRSSTEPAKHLKYMPSRVRESYSDADAILITKIHHLASHSDLLPDAQGTLRNGTDLVALSHDKNLSAAAMRAWSDAPHTPDNVPHPDCYSDPYTRVRARELYRRAYFSPTAMPGDNDLKVPVATEIGLSEWLTLLGDVDDERYSMTALRILAEVSDKGSHAAGSATIVPTNRGRRVPLLGSDVHLPAASTDSEFNYFELVSKFIAEDQRCLSVLRQYGFREVDERVVFDAQLSRLGDDASDAEWDALWANVVNVEIAFAADKLRQRLWSGSVIKVPTVASTWEDSRDVFDFSNLGIDLPWPNRCLDTRIVFGNLLPEAVGIVSGFSANWPVIEEDEFRLYLNDFYRYLIDQDLAGDLSEAARWIRDDERGPGPIGVLRMLAESDDTEAKLRTTRALLQLGGRREWKFTSPEGSVLYPAPHIWALMKWGMVETTMGIRPVSKAVHPLLLDAYGKWLPVSGNEAGKLPLPDSIDDVSFELLEDSLSSDNFSPLLRTATDATVSEYLLAVLPVLGSGEEWDGHLAAFVNGILRSVAAREVYIAANADELSVLRSAGLACLMVGDADKRSELLALCTANEAKSAIQLEVIIGDPRNEISLTDCFPGLLPFLDLGHRKLEIVPCSEVLVRRITPAGAEDRNVRMVMESNRLVSTLDPLDSANASDILEYINRKIQLNLSAQDIEHVVSGVKDRETELLKDRCRAAGSDAERIKVLCGSTSLRRKLPAGLIETMDALGKPVHESDLAQLFVDTHGFDGLFQMRDILHTRRLSPPDRWAGSAPARRFVRDLGFDERHAGEPTIRKPDSTIVMGKPNLGTLHDYQQSALEKIRFLLRSNPGKADKGLVELPTGAGKTRVAVQSIVEAFLDGDFQRTAPVLWVAQSVELCEQAVTTWSEVWRELSDDRQLTICRFFESRKPEEPDTELSVVVATEAMLAEHLNNDQFSWVFDPVAVVVDEAHRVATSTQFRDLFRRLGVGPEQKERPLLGLSATPYRGTSAEATANLARRFGSRLIQTLGDDPVRELQERGVLSLVDHEVLPGVTIELTMEELEEARSRKRLSSTALNRVAMDEMRTKGIVEDILARPADWKILVFMPSVLSAQVLSAVLNAEGVRSGSVSGRSSRRHRQRIVEEFRDGDLQVLVNCDLLTQGFDAPQVRALYVARPTLSQSFYVQMVGRGLRGPRNNGSERCLVVDLQDTIDNEIDIDLAYRGFVSQWEAMAG